MKLDNSYPAEEVHPKDENFDFEASWKQIISTFKESDPQKQKEAKKKIRKENRQGRHAIKFKWLHFIFDMILSSIAYGYEILWKMKLKVFLIVPVICTFITFLLACFMSSEFRAGITQNSIWLLFFLALIWFCFVFLLVFLKIIGAAFTPPISSLSDMTDSKTDELFKRYYKYRYNTEHITYKNDGKTYPREYHFSAPKKDSYFCAKNAIWKFEKRNEKFRLHITKS